MGPLDQLTIHGCDLLATFLDPMGFDIANGPFVLPPIKDLTVSRTPTRVIDED